MLEIIEKVNSAINGVVWGWPALILLGFVGVLMTVLTKVFQIGHIGHWFKNTIGAIFGDRKVTKHTKDKSISQFQSLCTALAATVGTGNIVGVASAIAVGGPGAVFWMWVIAFFGMMTNYSENVLGILFRRKNSKGEWNGGAMYYLRDGLGGKKGLKWLGIILAVLFSVFCLLASFGIGNMSQVNSMVGNITNAFSIPTVTITESISLSPQFMVGIFLLIAVGLVVVGGIKRIASFTEKIVPFMIIIYVIGAFVIIGKNITQVPAVFASIFKYAFTAQSVAGGAAGFTVMTAMKMGFKRGVFSNEAGLGSSVMVHSSSNVKEPVRQGMWGIFEVFADTIIVCTLTALTILSSGLFNLETGLKAEAYADVSDSALMGEAFRTVFGDVGPMFVAIAIFFFAYSTVLGWSHYGTIAWEYLFGRKSTFIYRIIFVVMVLGGAVLNATLAWDLSDTFNGLMMLPNLIGVLILCPLVVKCTKNYVDRRIRKKDVVPMLSVIPEIQETQLAEMLAEESEEA